MFLQLQREREDLLRRQEDAVLELQQKMSLKEQQLLRRVEALRRRVEKRDAQLNTVLSSTHPDPSAASEASRRLQVPHPEGL